MSHKKKSIPNWLIIALFSIWVVATVLGLWWFQQSKLKAFIGSEDDPRFYQPAKINQFIRPYIDHLEPALPGQQTLFHFWRSDCLCNRVSQRHFNRLLQNFNSEELRIVIIAHPDSTEEDIQRLQQLNGNRLQVIRAQPELKVLPSSPALAILNEQHQLGYFGPYGFGAFCTSNEDDFLSSLVRDLSLTDQNEAPTFINVIGEGCFCSWQ